MNIVDILIIILVLSCGIIGLKRGIFKQTVVTIGTILVFICAYYFKDYLADFFSYNFPFFHFKGQFAGLSTVNIIMYQMAAFLIVLLVFTTILAILIKVTGIFEKILRMTIILGIPSKILGFCLGLVEGYVIIFISLFILTQPAINIKVLNESSFTPKILTSSPVLSKVVKNTEDSVIEIYKLGKDYVIKKDVNEFNKSSIDIMLKNKIITKEYVLKLIDKNKIKIENIDSILNNY